MSMLGGDIRGINIGKFLGEAGGGGTDLVLVRVNERFEISEVRDIQDKICIHRVTF